MRILTVLFAYACAAVAAVLLFLLPGAITSEASLSLSVADLRFIGILVASAAIYALPVALPVVIVTEFRKSGSLKTFVGAGAILGLLLTFLFTEVPFEWSNLIYSGIFLPIAIIAAGVFWLVAWKWSPPKSRETLDIDRAYL